MTYDEIEAALLRAGEIMSRADRLAQRSIRFSIGRLRRLDIDVDDLRELKRELRNFDITTGKWK